MMDCALSKSSIIHQFINNPIEYVAEASENLPQGRFVHLLLFLRFIIRFIFIFFFFVFLVTAHFALSIH